MRVALDTAFESWWGAENAARAMPEPTAPAAAELVAGAPPPPRPPDRETTWVAGVLWRAHAACLAKQGAAPDFTAEQLAAALATGPEVDEVDAPTRACEGAHAEGDSDESPCRGEA